MKKLAKKSIRRKNPDDLTEELNLLRNKKVRVHSRFSTILGLLKTMERGKYYIEIENAAMYFKSENVKDILNKTIYLKDMTFE